MVSPCWEWWPRKGCDPSPSGIEAFWVWILCCSWPKGAQAPSLHGHEQLDRGGRSINPYVSCRVPKTHEPDLPWGSWPQSPQRWGHTGP